MYFGSTIRKLTNARTVSRFLDRRSQKCGNFGSAKKFHTSTARSLLRFQLSNGVKLSKLQNCHRGFLSKSRCFSLSTTSNIWNPFRSLTKEPSAIAPEVVVSPSIEAITPPNVGSVTDSVTVVDPGITDIVAGAIVDPPFIEMGLATKWFPNHFVHQLLEFVHLNTDLPWWSTIVVGTIVIRVLSLPLYIYTRKFSINQNNHQDEMKKLMDKYQKLKLEDNALRTMVAEQKLQEFYRRTGTGPMRAFATNSSMTILFITCAMALRQMCAVPVPSFVEGGALWFTDLSIADPYFILPAVVGAVIGLTINLSLHAGTMSHSYAGIIRKVRFLPVVGMPLVFGKASCGIVLYWLTTSVFSLGCQRLLLIPAVKQALKFPAPKPPSEESPGLRKKITTWREDSYRKASQKMRVKEIKRERKDREKARKKELKKDPPVTYEIGVDAMPAKQHTPDFEQEWRPPRPRQFGLN